ncbi:hypothetical protein ASE86_07105 [Sphingomonas sp. Leaf33]|uniref:hypothetical protein n=1 Tax=Sphingomonas sp. Leaf33 TaxID=1736215 RepID=UPI0006FB3F44|nr:hypothetical protein [Sphingomonas sp. Leaf33]KQN25942.1 hypothetical protein ASE86_07105 [Sphingomonas sp. Leaf33]
MLPPFHALDLAAAGRLPAQWQDDVRTLASSPMRQVLHDGDPGVPDDQRGLFACVDGAVIRSGLPWMWSLYHRDLRDFAARSVGYPLFAANRLRAAVTLNILEREGAANTWHSDMNAVTGVFYAMVPDSGGELQFRDSSGTIASLRPRPGLFVCFEGAMEHRVTPLPADGLRLAIPMVYHRSATDQPPAYGDDVYTVADES